MNRCGASLLLVVLSGLLGGGCQQICDSDLSCDENQVCDPRTRRCVARPAEGPIPCGSDSTCADNRRVCLEGFCRFAPQCLNVAGDWVVYRGTATQELGLVRLVQAARDCTVSGRDVDGGAAFTLGTGTVDRQGALTALGISIPGTSTTTCSGQFGGDETIRVDCAALGDGGVLHFYARPSSDRHLAPSRCGAQGSPCGEPCQTNSLGLPMCPR